MDYCKIKRKSVWSYALTLLIAGAVLMTAPISAWAVHMGGGTGHAGNDPNSLPAENIKSTLHNLSSSSLNTNNLVTADITTTEVCVFCHTPHGADAGNLGGPLWNRNTSTQTYTPYSGANMEVAQGAPQGVSLACLSCHDGAAAVDALINTSGSGGLKIAAIDVTTGLMGAQAGKFLLDGNKSMNDNTRSDTGANYDTLATGAGPFPNLTLNLSDDHPISMKICADDGTNAGTGGAGLDPQFMDVCTQSPAQVTTGLRFLTRSSSNTVNVDVRDRIRAYPTPGSGSGSGQFVECASCHNPHAPRPLFLRLPSPGGENAVTTALERGGDTTAVSAVLGTGSDTAKIGNKPNAGSLVCITCHQK
jgi:cytochrome c2